VIKGPRVSHHPRSTPARPEGRLHVDDASLYEQKRGMYAPLCGAGEMVHADGRGSWGLRSGNADINLRYCDGCAQIAGPDELRAMSEWRPWTVRAHEPQFP
jgi:hypothetical protein